jgi:hypothetical protein
MDRFPGVRWDFLSGGNRGEDSYPLEFKTAFSGTDRLFGNYQTELLTRLRNHQKKAGGSGDHLFPMYYILQDIYGGIYG